VNGIAILENWILPNVKFFFMAVSNAVANGLNKIDDKDKPE